MSIISHKIGISIPYSFTVTIDADLSKNDRYRTLADAIDVGRRTFLVNGVISTNAASKAQVLFSPVTPIAISDPQCSLPRGAFADVVSVNRVHKEWVSPVPHRTVDKKAQ